MKYAVELSLITFEIPYKAWLYRVYNYKKNKYSYGFDKDKAHEYTTEQNANKAAQALNGSIKII